MMHRRNVSTEELRAWLQRDGWRELDHGRFTVALAPPPALKAPRGYSITVPLEDSSDGSPDSMFVGAIGVLARLYHLSVEDLLAKVDGGTPSSGRRLTVALESGELKRGGIPLARAEKILDGIKSALRDTAAFLVTDLPSLVRQPAEAREYLDACRLDGARRGSFVLDIELPAPSVLSDSPSLFSEEQVRTDDVTDLFAAISAHVAKTLSVTRAPASREELLEGLESARPLLSINVLEDLRRVFAVSPDATFTFAVSKGRRVQTATTPPVRARELSAFKDYIQEARTFVRSDLPIEVEGRIVELRCRDPQRRRNHVGITAVIDGRSVNLSLKLTPADYYYAILAHERNARVHLKGRARKQRTQWRILEITDLQLLDTEGSPS